MAANTSADVVDEHEGDLVVRETTLDDVIEEVERSWGCCAGLYFHGSTIFGNKKPTDIDLLAIVDEPTLKPVKAATTDAQFTFGPYEVSVYTRSFWLRKLEEMDLTMLTCLSLPPEFVVRALDDERVRGLTINLEKLSEAIISYAEYTWLKARRVLLRWEDPHKSSKNVYFVFRVIELGRQLVEHGRIVNFTAANHWWEHIHGLYESLQIKPEPKDWDVVEAVMANHFQDQVARFQAAVERAGQGSEDPGPAAEPELGGGCSRLESGDACPVCLESIGDVEVRAEGCQEAAGAACALAHCRHRFHAACLAASVRGAAGRASCPLCRGPLRLGLDEDHAVARELERRGIREGARRAAPAPARPAWRRAAGPGRRRYGGYPATVLLEEELPAAEDREVAEEVPAEDDEVGEVEVPTEDPSGGVPSEEVPAEESPAEAAPAEAEAGSEASGGSLADWEVLEVPGAHEAQRRGGRCSIA